MTCPLPLRSSGDILFPMSKCGAGKYITVGKEYGWNMKRWKGALDVTMSCRDIAVKESNPVRRMEKFINLRKERHE